MRTSNKVSCAREKFHEQMWHQVPPIRFRAGSAQEIASTAVLHYDVVDFKAQQYVRVRAYS